MAHTVRDKAKLLARVRRIHGQTAALEKQLDEESDCIAVLQQIAAIRGGWAFHPLESAAFARRTP